MKRAAHQARLSFPPSRAAITPVMTGRVMTAAALVNSIDDVHSRTAELLTKRRAVDFCRVATAICTARPVSCAA
jgi:hypothetical protein